MENTIQLQLLAITEACKKFQNDYLPKGCHLHINLSDDWATVGIHRCADHAAGLEVKRLIGLKDAEKQTYEADNPWHTLRGTIAPKVSVDIFCKGLPPMCRIETYEEEIPKTDIVTLAETVKVKRTRICCGEGK